MTWKPSYGLKKAIEVVVELELRGRQSGVAMTEEFKHTARNYIAEMLDAAFADGFSDGVEHAANAVNQTVGNGSAAQRAADVMVTAVEGPAMTPTITLPVEALGMGRAKIKPKKKARRSGAAA